MFKHGLHICDSARRISFLSIVEKTEIRSGITVPQKTFQENHLSSNMNIEILKIVIATFICCIALYGCETWTLTKEDLQKLSRCGVFTGCRVSWKERWSHEQVLEDTEAKKLDKYLQTWAEYETCRLTIMSSCWGDQGGVRERTFKKWHHTGT